MTNKTIDDVAGAGTLNNARGLIIGRSSTLYRTTLDALHLRLFAEKRRVPPLATDFPTWVNQQSAAVEDIDGIGLRVYTPITVNDNTGRLNGRVRAVPAGTAWACVFRCMRYGTWFDYNAVGIGLRDSVGGKVKNMAIGPWVDGSMIAQNWTNYSTFASLDTTYITTIQRNEVFLTDVWMRVRFDNTNYYFDVSPDGVVWAAHLVFDKAYFANPADQIGVFINPRSTSSLWENDEIGMVLMHFNEE